MKIRFVETRTVKKPGGKTFHEGKVYDLPDGAARHWLRRGVAVDPSEEPAPEKTEKPDKPGK